jgi:drug/metabolite transporter (DMT)-like permease
MTTYTAKQPLLKFYFLFILVIFIWGVGWPINKIGLQFMPPLWFVLFRILFSGCALFLFLGVRNQIYMPRKRDLSIIFSLGFLQIGLFIILVTLGLNEVEAGRSAIITYTTPLWTTPIAAFVFKEKIAFQKLIGIFFGFVGILILFSPWGINWHDHNILLGNFLILTSAICWALAIICSRYMKWYREPIELLPWQFLVALIPTALVCFIVDPRPHIIWNTEIILILSFTAIFTTAFAYWAFILVSKTLPITTTSMGLLAIPIISFFTSYFFTGEQITLNKIIAMLFILIGLFFAIMVDSRKK